MRHVRSALFLLALSGAASAGPPAPPTENVHAICERVDAHYNHLSSLKERFEEIYQGSGTTRTESGVLWLKRPGKMRWEYEQPRSKLFISDGKEVWFYVPGEADARRARVKKLDDLRSPLRYLLGKTHLEKEFRVLGAEFVDYEGTSFSSSPIVTILSAVPKGMEGQIRGVELGLNLSSQIVFIRIHETDGSTTEFRFADIVEDAPAPENLFHFSPPPGVGVISSEDLAP